MPAPAESMRAGTRQRIAAAAVLGLLAAGWTLWTSWREPPEAASDFDIIWIAARALLRGDDPYAAVLRAGWKWPLYYPLPAVLVGVPFAALSRIAARAAFVGLSAGLFAFAMSGRGWWGLLALLSPAFLHGFYHAQWTPILVAAMLLPPIGGVLVVKPSVGLAYFVSRPSRWAVYGGLALVALSFAALPRWPVLWVDAMRSAPHIIPPMLRPGGFLLLIGLLGWRVSEGRLLAGLGVVPHVTFLYETLPLFTIPASFRQMAVLVLCSHAGAFLIAHFAERTASDVTNLEAHWPFLLVTGYLPALLMFLANNRTTLTRSLKETLGVGVRASADPTA